MRLFSKLKKQSVPTVDRYASFDKMAYYEEQALKNYLYLYRKEECDLTKEDYHMIQQFACTHIAFFMTWIVLHHFEGTLHLDNKEQVEALRSRQITSIDFSLTCCDGKFNGEDVNDHIFPFVASYYETQYFKDYSDWVVNELCDLPFEFAGSWEDYDTFEPMLDAAYQSFLQS